MSLTPVTCPLDCAEACGMLVESDAEGRFVALRGNPAHGYSRGVLCGKTAIYGDLLRSPERLLQPLERRVAQRVNLMRVIMEGSLLLARRTPPELIVDELKAFIPQRQWKDVSAAKRGPAAAHA